MRRQTVLLLVMTLVLHLAVGIPKAFATPTNCTSSTAWEHHFIGGENFSLTNYGVEVEIETQSVDICPSSGVSLWPMVGGPGASDYVQVGWLQRAGGSPMYFYESSSNNGFHEQLTWGTASGFNVYRVNYVDMGNQNLNYWDFLINGNSVHSTPVFDLGWSPSQAFAQAELHDSGDQVPGSVTNPVSFTNVKVKTTKNGSYSITSLPKAVDSTISSMPALT